MSAKNEFIGRKFLVGLICMLFLILFAFLITDSYLGLIRDQKIHTAGAKDMIDQRMRFLLSEMSIFSQHAGNDLMFLSRLSSLRNVINSVEAESREYEIKNLEGDFLEFLKGSIAQYQLRYIDEKGDEVVRIEFDGNNYKVVPEDELQNKKHRYYFSETIKLNEGEIYISPLDLNVENGEIENRGTVENPKYVPVIRTVTPVFSEEGTLKGIILFNIYADYFLDDVRRSQRAGEAVFLIDKEGYYLSHPDRKKEFAFMFEGNENFYNDYPEISEDIVSDFKKRRFESDDLIFSFKYLHPTVGDVGIHRGSEKIFGKNPEEYYFWVLVTVSEKTEITKVLGNLEKDYLYFLLFSGLIILITILLVLILVFKSSVSKSSRGGRK